jgi:hypothetical protein
LGEKKPLLWLYSKQLQLEPEALKVLKLQELDIIQITPISSSSRGYNIILHTKNLMKT